MLAWLHVSVSKLAPESIKHPLKTCFWPYAANLTAMAGCLPCWVQVCMTGPAELCREEPLQIWNSTLTLLTWTQRPALLSCLLASRLAQAGQSLRRCLLRTGELPLACQLIAETVTQSETANPITNFWRRMHRCQLVSHDFPLCRASFDRLTELSSILVNHGDLLVHSKSRERLQREVNRAENGALEAVMSLISRGAGPSSGAASSGGATAKEVRLGGHAS